MASFQSVDPWACNVCTLQHVEPLDTRLTSCRSCGTARVDARYDIDSDMDAAIALSLGLTAGTFAGASTAPALLASALPSSAATHGHSSSASAASLTSDDDVQLAIALSLSEMPTEPPKPTTSEHLAQLRAKRRATNQSKDPDRTRTPMAPGVNAAPTRITATQTRPAGLRNLPDCAASRRPAPRPPGSRPSDPAPVAAPRLVLPADPIRRATRLADPAAGRMPPATNDGADRPVQGGATDAAAAAQGQANPQSKVETPKSATFLTPKVDIGQSPAPPQLVADLVKFLKQQPGNALRGTKLDDFYRAHPSYKGTGIKLKVLAGKHPSRLRWVPGANEGLHKIMLVGASAALSSPASTASAATSALVPVPTGHGVLAARIQQLVDANPHGNGSWTATKLDKAYREQFGAEEGWWTALGVTLKHVSRTVAAAAAASLATHPKPIGADRVGPVTGSKPSTYKTKMCPKGGSCPNKKKCSFAHSNHELRSPSPAGGPLKNQTKAPARSEVGTGKIIKILPDKKCGFIRRTNQTGRPAAKSGATSPDNENDQDVWFHFDRLRAGGLEPCRYDKVHFTLDLRPRAPSKPKPGSKKRGNSKTPLLARATKVELIELEPTRSADVYNTYLGTLLAEISQKSYTALLKATQCPPLWLDLARVCNADTTSGAERTMLTAHIAKLLKLLVATPQESASSVLSSMAAQGLFDRGSCLFSWVLGEQGGLSDIPQFTSDEVTVLFRKAAQDARARLLPFIQVSAASQDPEHQVNFFMSLLRAATVTVGDITNLNWADLPLIITTGEFNASGRDLPAPVIRKGPYRDTQHYFEVYFRLLREDCFAPLRDRVREWREGQLDPRDMTVFTNVIVTDIGCPDQRSGGGTVLRFNLGKDGAKATKLMYGNLTAISPRSGDIRKPIWGTICQRESDKKLDIELCTEMNGGLDDATALEMLLGTRCILAVSPTFYRAYQPVLRSLQSMRDGVVNFRDELVDVNADRATKHDDSLIGRCTTLDGSIIYSDMRSVMPAGDLASRLERGDLANTTLDASQVRALHHVLTNRLAIVQGPPGTGKTFIGVRLVRLLLSMKAHDGTPLCNGPILVLTYKNHALDDFLMDCLKPDVAGPDGVARVGGSNLEGSKLDRCNMRTLVREPGVRGQSTTPGLADAVSGVRNARTQVTELHTKLSSSAEELAGAMTLSGSTFKSELCSSQLRSLIQSCPKAIYTRSCRQCLQPGDEPDKTTLFEALSDSSIDAHWQVVSMLAGKWGAQCDFGSIDDGEADQSSAENSKLGVKATLDERSQLEEDERIASVGTSDVKPASKSVFKRDMIKLGKRSSQRVELGENNTAVLMNESDIWSLGPRDKAMLAQAMLSRRYQNASSAFSLDRDAYVEACQQLQKAREIEWVQILRQRKVLGMTITGASIHSSMLQQLRPSVVIVEEAAEVLEPQLVATLGPHVKQLVMIGDHKQLRPSVEHHPLVKDCHFDVSMMERLVDNELPFATLEQQGRMRPELAFMLQDIYPNLKTNTSAVTDESRPAPRCMAKSLYWWDHTDPETVGRSPQNEAEADRVVKLALFFITQGYSPSQVTVLGAYSGQVSLLRQRFANELPSVWPGQLSKEAERHRISEIEVQLRRSPPGKNGLTAHKYLELGDLYAARAKDGDLHSAKRQYKDGLNIAPVDSKVQLRLKAARTELQLIVDKQDELDQLWKSDEGTTPGLSKMTRSTVELARQFQIGDKLEFAQATFGMLACELTSYQTHIKKDHPELGPAPRQKVLDRLQTELADVVTALTHIRRDINGIDVQTIDRYQGAENDIVIVSLVRSDRLGYLTMMNRRCVAQSRAKCGLYFVGNATLFEKHDTWAGFLAQLTEHGNVGTQISLRCSRHQGSAVDAETADDIDLKGGVCQQTCLEKMAFCDHLCQKRCHADTGHLVCDAETQVECSHHHIAIRKCSEASNSRCGVCDRAKKDREEHERNLERIEAEHSQALADAKRVDQLRQQDRVRFAAEREQKRQAEELRQQQRVKVERDKAEKMAAEVTLRRELELRRKQGERELHEVRRKIKSGLPPPLVRELHNHGADMSEYQEIKDRTERYAQSDHNIPMNVTRIEKITNLKLREEWCKAKLDLTRGANDDSRLLFHGTTIEGVEGITKTGFRLPNRSENNMFGCGVYFATDSTKSAQDLYTKGSKRLLLCDVVLGKPITVDGLKGTAKKHSLSKHVKMSSKNRPYLDVHLDKVRKGGYDSVYAQRGTRDSGGVVFDEYIVYDQRLALPKYIVHFGGAGGMAKPFAPKRNMEILPSRHYDPGSEEDMAFRLAESQFLRMLANSGRSGKITKVEYTHNTRLRDAFDRKRDKYDHKYGKHGHETRLGFHGTKEEHFKPILANGFDVSKVGSTTDAGYWGAGIYFSENTATSIGYSPVLKKLLLSQLLLGKPYPIPQGTLPYVLKDVKPGFDTHILSDGDEIVMFDNDAMLPMFVIHYQ